ncbi:hypothetical protein BST61_g909 [Cercospora zeina]
MSLNGLDTPDVQDACQTAIAEAGGWFLLKYTSRDAVELLAKGKHGVSEARNALVAYAEPSPLYGLLMYRRRRILLKYIPDGTSRLLQARTSVHLQDVLERYSPYETLLELTSGDGLNDTALAASFQLHTASPSPSMGRLDELREEDEDEGEGGAADAPSASTQASQRPRGIGKRAPRSMTSLHAPTTGSRRTTSPASPANSPALTLPAPVPAASQESKSLPLTPLESSEASTPGDQPVAIPEHQPQATESPVSDATTALQHVRHTQDELYEDRLHSAALHPTDQKPTEPSPERDSFSARGGPMRSQSMDEEPFDFSQYDALFKPKVKLAPRPIIKAPEKALRPTAPRVSAVPATLRTLPKKQEALRPRTSGQDAMSRSATAPSALESAAPAMPRIPDIPAFASRPMSRGSVRSAPLHKSGPMSADKIRLMKAVELRKKQLRKSQSSMFSSIEEAPPNIPSVPTVSESQEETSDQGMRDGHEEARHKVLTENEPEQHSTDDESQNQSTKADSGIDLRYGTPDTQRTEETIDEAPEIVALNGISEEKATESSPQETPEGASADEMDTNHDDAVSTTASQTPTERPAVSDHGSETTARGSQHLKVDEGDAATSSVALADQQDPSPSGTAAASSSLHRRSVSDLASRRRGYVQPLALGTLQNELDDEELDSDDDALFEELHSATVQEARPIMVARSPIAMTFQGRSASTEASHAPRPVPTARAFTSPEKAIDDERPKSVKSRPSSINSRSVSPLPPAERQELLSAGRARNVSSGISKRIQALAELSARESEILPGPPAKQSRRVLPATRPISRKRQSRSAADAPTSPHSNEDQWLTGSVQHDPVTKRDSISVTTRIARPGSSAPDSAHGPTPPFSAAPSTTPSPPAVESEPPLSSNNSIYSNDTRSVKSSRSRNRSFWSQRQKSMNPALDDVPPPPPNVREHSVMSPNSNDETAAPEKASKASRFFKRMSNLAGTKKKNSPVEPKSTPSAVKTPDSTAPVSVAGSKPDTPPAAVVGDLNVQFPDSLLWKRRIVTIDDYGVLQFAIAQAMDIHRGVAMKRYPLTKFNEPFMPVLDQQELPYSVVLEFEDGTALQVACEDGMTQRQVLSLLTTYWRAYTADHTVEQEA